MKFGRLTIIKTVSRGRYAMVECRCDCGATVERRIGHVKSGATQSCGCLASERLIARNTIHGACRRGKVTVEFTAWSLMRGRCLDPGNRSYSYYGGRGIKVCERWDSFENFLADMGPRPSARHSIDREKVDGNYEPGNCHWATKETQARNKTNTTLSVPIAALIREMVAAGLPKIEVSRLLGVNYSSVKQVSLNKQWVPEVPA